MFSKSKSFHKPCPPNEHYLKEPSLRIGSHLLKKSLMANFFFCRVRYILFHTLNIIPSEMIRNHRFPDDFRENRSEIIRLN